MKNSIRTLAPSDRMVWFDANRVFAALGVVLIHCTTDFAGQPFSQAAPGDRTIPVIIRAISELSGSEMFFFFSLFLIAFKLDRRGNNYSRIVGDQAQRLIAPFAFWTVFYAFFRLGKATAFGYQGAILTELAQPQSWVGYFALGTAEYHLHFLPTLFLILLLYPCMRAAARYPIFGLLLAPLLGGMDAVQGFIWGHVADPVLRDYLVRAVKVLGYVGYGMAAFAIFSFWRDGLPRGEARLIRNAALFIIVCFVVVGTPYYFEVASTGKWVARQGFQFYAHFLMPVAVFSVFMGSQYAHWSPAWSRLARYTFGVYLAHPIFVDLFDIALHASGFHLAPAVQVVAHYAFAVTATFALVVFIARQRWLAWTIGLGPLPWTQHGGQSLKAAPQ